MSEAHERLQGARERAGYSSATAAADAFGWASSTYLGHENGSRGLRSSTARTYALAFRVKPEWLLYGRDEVGPSTVADPQIKALPDGRVTIDIKAEVSVGVAAQILTLIDGDKT